MKKQAVSLALFVVALCFCLTGCKGSDYKKALRLQAEGDYPAAIELFEKLGGYKDSAAQLTACNQSVTYQQAAEAMGKGDYVQAAELFESLGGFSDAAQKLEECSVMRTAIRGFDDAAEQLEQKNAELNMLIIESEELLESGRMVPDADLIADMTQGVEAARAAWISVPPMPDTAQALDEAAKAMSEVDYADIADRLRALVQRSRKEYLLVTAPKEEYIVSCLREVPGVLSVVPANENTAGWSDFNKDGGVFYSCVFFVHEDVDTSEQKTVPVIDRFVDSGGQVEAYSSPEAARGKFELLESFRGTPNATGYNTLLGSVIVRVSDELPESRQKSLTQSIIDALTNVKEEEAEP